MYTGPFRLYIWGVDFGSHGYDNAIVAKLQGAIFPVSIEAEHGLKQDFSGDCLCLSLFFLPVFKWNKQYYVQMSCCNTLYALDPVIGKRIARGEDIEILPEHLTEVQTGWRSRYKRCGNCGFETQEDYEYCPKCGRKF